MKKMKREHKRSGREYLARNEHNFLGQWTRASLDLTNIRETINGFFTAARCKKHTIERTAHHFLSVW